jgi:hypothetical protein
MKSQLFSVDFVVCGKSGKSFVLGRVFFPRERLKLADLSVCVFRFYFLVLGVFSSNIEFKKDYFAIEILNQML